MAAKNQQFNSKTVDWIFESLKEEYASFLEVQERNVIDELVFNLLLHGSTQQRALAAFLELKSEYHDWNEVRVTVPSSIEKSIKGVGLESVKSLRMVKILQGIFEDRSEVDLEFLHEMSTPAVANYLGCMEGIGENTVETVLTCALNKHVFPLTRSVLRFSQRFGLIESAKNQEETKKLKTLVESSITEGELASFIVSMDLHTEICCRSDKPRCTDCPIKTKCAYPKNSVK